MVLHVQPFCGFFTKIYDSVFDEGAPVVYADFYGFACSKGLNEHFAREGKGGMRCVQVPGAHVFSDRRFSADEPPKGAFIVIGGNSRLFIRQRLFHVHGMVAVPPDGIGAGHVARIIPAFGRGRAGCQP